MALLEQIEPATINIVHYSYIFAYQLCYFFFFFLVRVHFRACWGTEL